MPNDAGWTETGVLPPRSALLQALRDTPDLPARAHPVLVTARALARCHERRLRALAIAHDTESTSISAAIVSAAVVEDIDRERDTLVDRINGWVAGHVVHRHGASLHTETLGAVIDRMASKWVAAQACLGTDLPGRNPLATSTGSAAAETPGVAAAGLPAQHREPLSGTEAHLQWTRLAELADGYQDLVTEVVQHRRRLPVH